MNKVRVGLVGAAFAAGLHIDAYLRCQDLSEVIAVCDKKFELAKDFAKRYGIKKVFDNADELLNCEDIDVVEYV